MLNRRRFLSMLLTAAASGMIPQPRLLRKAHADSNDILDTVVIGGGIAGLTSAYLLRDTDVLLLEAEDRFGGRTVSGVRGGWHYTKGTEYLGQPEGVFADIISDLNLKLVEIPTPMDQIWRDGTFYDGSSGRVKLLTEKGGLPAFNRFVGALKEVSAHYEEVPEFDPAGPLARLDSISCEEWFKELDLPDVYGEMYNVTFRGLFGANIREVSALGAFAEVAFDFEGADHPVDAEDVKEIIRSANNESSGAYSFRTGITEVTDGLANALAEKAQGNARVLEVTEEEDDLYTVRYDQGGQERHVLARSVIFASPLPVTLHIGRDLFTPGQQLSLGRVPYAEFVTAAIFSDTPIYTDAFDLALPDGWSATDVYDSTWMQRQLGENHDGYVASMYIGPRSFKEQGFIDLSDEELLEMGYKDIQAIWPDIRERVTGHDVHRFKHGYPVMIPGAFKRLTELYASLDAGVQIAGDGMIYPTFEAAVQSGAIAAQRILDMDEV